MEPGKGKLDLPGGFVDPDEKVEDAIRRECFEELGIKLDSLEYFTSFPNVYDYKDIRYNTCDMIFTAKISTNDFKIDKDELENIVFIGKKDIKFDEIAFPSIKNAISQFIKEK